ncbi:carotenoid oxygenase family protein [Ideonella paludis]|uniref:Carotenoid oxygenase family protein n=1 Tax=Ideonella paludis TaxID=1233411 RepID=A0ABS5DT01_9BURK|nr:carotenoid oxygenase family protein [Ideonella paludis]MBQ0934264.1 carotenoid oxygenase family protein [Ideonella paludis]
MTHAHLQRRDWLRLLGATAATGLASPWARSAQDTAAARFAQQIEQHPTLTPLRGMSEHGPDTLRCDALSIEGRWPEALRGRFHRNGPALFERNGQRYHHWFDGDGMVQQFSLNGRQISHQGRFVNTRKLQAERAAGRFVTAAFGTPIKLEVPVTGPDSVNAANTSVIEHGGKLLALWEGGSAYEMNVADLSTRGPLAWQPDWAGVPFSAHPKLDAQGTLWNIGTWADKIATYQIAPNGQLQRGQVATLPWAMGMVHDMAITPRFFVVPLPPLRMDIAAVSQGVPLEQAFSWRGQEPLRIWVAPKDDIQQARVFELPAEFIFHVGNAYEVGEEIVLSYVANANADVLTRNIPAMMRGEARPTAAVGAASVVVRLNLRTGRASRVAGNDSSEFPRIHPRLNGQRHRWQLTASSWRPRSGVDHSFFHGLALTDQDSGRTERYDFGEHAIVEEHLWIAKPGSTDERDAWLLGTHFDSRAKVTKLSVFDARSLADGPLAVASLPYWLPLGFHGSFQAG